MAEQLKIEEKLLEEVEGKREQSLKVPKNTDETQLLK